MTSTEAALKVSIETTPNPATMKFRFPFQVTESAFECSSAQETERSPLAAKIFGFPWTSSVFIGSDFVSVTKQDWVDWNYLAEPLAGLIQEHVDAGQPIVVETIVSSSDDNESDSPLVKQIKSVINREIRPVVALDGGDIVFNRFDEGVVYLQMKGSCAGCPSSSATLKDGIEVRLKEVFPEIREVVSI